MDDRIRVFSPIPILIGFLLSGLYGILSSGSLLLFGHASDVSSFLVAYFVDFNSAIAGGLVFATALTVFRTENYVIEIIEGTFSYEKLRRAGYYESRKKFYNPWMEFRFSAAFMTVALFVFIDSIFPLSEAPATFLAVAACAQYAAGVYIGRKIFHIAKMIQSIEDIRVGTTLFTMDRLSGILPYVNYISSLTAFTVCIGVISYYKAPFVYHGGGAALRTFMLFPAIVAIPVLLFSYYPRVVVKRLYEKSIDVILREFTSQAKKENMPESERKYKALELRKMLRDELNSRLRTTLEDVPMVIVLGVALLSALKGLN